MCSRYNLTRTAKKEQKNIIHGELAQLGERNAGSVEVTGSSPVFSISRKALALQGLFFFSIFITVIG
jgi:hypothetical protein